MKTQKEFNQLPTIKKIAIIRALLNKHCLERSETIDALLASWIIGQHVLLLGEPGTGKSLLVRLFCQAMGGKFYQKLISYETKSDEIFGPFSIKQLQDSDQYVRVTTGRLPEADVVYLDEIFKGNSVILNGLLQAINERVFENPKPSKIPLRMVVGSSNELPDQDDNLGAFTDRFLHKCSIKNIQNEQNFEEILNRSLSGYDYSIPYRLNLSDANKAQKIAQTVKVPIKTLVKIKNCLATKGFSVSDRKWTQIVRFLQALAIIQGTKTVTQDILIDYIPGSIWEQPEDENKIRQILRDLLVELAQETEATKKSLLRFTDKFKRLSKANDGDNSEAIINIASDTRDLIDSLGKIDLVGLAQDVEETYHLAKSLLDDIKEFMSADQYRQTEKKQKELEDLINNLSVNGNTMAAIDSLVQEIAPMPDSAWKTAALNKLERSILASLHA